MCAVLGHFYGTSNPPLTRFLTAQKPCYFSIFKNPPKPQTIAEKSSQHNFFFQIWCKKSRLPISNYLLISQNVAFFKFIVALGFLTLTWNIKNVPISNWRLKSFSYIVIWISLFNPIFAFFWTSEVRSKWQFFWNIIRVMALS